MLFRSSYAGEALGDAFEAELGPASRSKEATFELDGVMQKEAKDHPTMDNIPMDNIAQAVSKK